MLDQIFIASHLQTPWRCKSPILSTFPWNNGAILHKGSLRSWVDHNRPVGINPHILQIIEKMATQMDQFDAVDFFTHPAHSHVWSVLGPGSQHKPEQFTSDAYSSYLGKIILSYQLLDILLWVSSFPDHPQLVSIPPGGLPPISNQLKVILEYLQTLPSTLPAYNDLSHICLGIDSPKPASIPVVLENPHLSIAATTLKIAMDNLAISTQHREANNYFFSNIYAVSSALRWFNPPSFIKTSRNEQLLSIIKEQAEMYRLPAPPLNHHGVQEILSLLHLSVGITPFIVFVPRALYDQSIDKENLIYYIRSLGTKPAGFSNLEKSLWKTIFSVATGESEITSFGHLYGEFDRSMKQISCPLQWSFFLKEAVYLKGYERDDKASMGVDNDETKRVWNPDEDENIDRGGSNGDEDCGDDHGDGTKNDFQRLPGSGSGSEDAQGVIDRPLKRRRPPYSELITPTSLIEPIKNAEKLPVRRSRRSQVFGSRLSSKPASSIADPSINSIDLKFHGTIFPSVVDLTGDSFTPNTIRNKNSRPKLSKESVFFDMYLPNPEALPTRVKFCTSEGVANAENKLLEDIVSSIERIYINNRPPHHDPSARNPSYDTSAPPISSIFVSDYAQFINMSAQEVEDIFRHRHILVLNAPLQDEGFSISTLSTYANVTRIIDMQDMENRSKCHQQGTLVDFFSESQRPRDRFILNVLDIPLGMQFRQTFPYNVLESHAVAWQQTRGISGFPSDNPPVDHLVWATAAMKNATSWIHIDANGLATAVDGVTGTKFWVICRPRRELVKRGSPGDLSSMFAFSDSQVDEASSSSFDHEAVVIQPGTVLLMRPNTPHYVLTAENSITLGRHMYCSTTIRDSCWAYIHTGILLYCITNTNHPQVEILLHRMLRMSINFYKNRNIIPIKGIAHLINPENTEGLLDLISLGNLLELCWIYDPLVYKKGCEGVSPANMAQRSATIMAYHEFQKEFSRSHSILIDNLPMDPMKTLFEPSILRMAVTIGKYKQLERKGNKAFTLQQLVESSRTHFSKCRPNLLEMLNEDISKPIEELEYCRTFEWSGPPFIVVVSGEVI